MEGIKNDEELKIFGRPIPFSELRLMSFPSENDFIQLGHTLGLEYPREDFAEWWNGFVETDRYPRVLVRFKELVNGIGNRLTSEEIKRFFGEPNPDLYNDRPIDVLGTEFGYYAVRRILTNVILREYA